MYTGEEKKQHRIIIEYDGFEFPHSTNKCNTCGREALRRCAKAEAFPRTMIEPALDRLYLGLGDPRKVGLLREEASHQTDRILDGAALPAMKRLAEVRAGAEHPVRPYMVGVLGTVVVGERQAQSLGIVAEPAREGHAHRVRALPRELGEPRVARRPLDGDLQGDGARARDHRVRLPVAHAAAMEHASRPGTNRDARGDMRRLVPSGVATVCAAAMGAYQTRDELSRLGIDPLVDRLVADGLVRMPPLPAARNELRRPPAPEPLGHVPAQTRVLETPTLMGQAVAGLGPVLGLVRQVVARVDRRGIAPEFPGQGTGRPPQDRGDLPERLPATAEHGQDIAFMTGEVVIGGGWHCPRILARMPSRPLGVALAY